MSDIRITIVDITPDELTEWLGVAIAAAPRPVRVTIERVDVRITEDT